MFKKILGFLLIFAVCLNGLEYFILEEEYHFKENKIYAKEIFPQITNDFLVLEIPKNSSNYQIKSSQLITLFEKEGVQVGAKSAVVTFKRGIKGDVEGIKKYIAGLFIQEYKKNNIKIKKIDLEQITPIDFNAQSVREIDFHPKLLKRKEGTFEIVVEDKGRNRKVFFKYNVDATLEGIITASEISGGQPHNYLNEAKREIAFYTKGGGFLNKGEVGENGGRWCNLRNALVIKK